MERDLYSWPLAVNFRIPSESKKPVRYQIQMQAEGWSLLGKNDN